MPFDSDRVVNSNYSRANLEPATIPSEEVSDTEPFAFVGQRASVPKDFKGLVKLVTIKGSEVLKYYLAPLTKRLDALEGKKETDPVAVAQVADLKKVVDALPAAPNIEPIKTDLKKVTDQYASLDKSKADQADLDAANAAIKALQSAIAALPKTGGGATPEQLKAVNDRIAAVEAALAVVEGIKGTLLIDDRSIFVVGSDLYGGARRLTESDVERIAQDSSNPVGRPLAALLGAGTTELIATPKQLLTWFFAISLRVWRIEIATDNANAGNRYLFVNNADQIALSSEVGQQKTIYSPSTSTGNQLVNELRFVDESPSSTVITDFYVSVTDSLEPAFAPRLTNGQSLANGDKFRYKDLIYAYAGSDELSGAWKATLVSTEGSDIARYSVLNPKLAVHSSAIAAIENKFTNLSNTKTVYTGTETLTVKTGSTVVVSGNGGIVLATPLVDGSEITLYDPYRRIKAGENTVTLTDGDRWLLADGTYSITPLTFADNPFLGGSITFKYATATKSWSSLIVYGTPLRGETTTQIGKTELDAITESIAKLPTTATTDQIKADVTKLKTDLTALDTSKADATKVTALETKVKAVEVSLKTLSDLPTSATKAQLDAAIADYTAKLKAANDAIALLPKSSVTDALTTRVTTLETTLTAEAAKIKALETAIARDNTAFYLDGGALFTAAEAIDKDFVHITTDGRIEVARNTVDSKKADGYVAGTVAVGATVQVLGTGARLPVGDFGLVGVPATTRLFLGDGGATLSNTGTGRYFQEVALVRGGLAYLRFDDVGYWVAAV